MKNNKFFVAIFCLIIAFSGASLRPAEVSQSSQGYWDWFKQGIQAIYNRVTLIWQIPLAIKSALNIPSPRLVGKTALDLDKNKLIEFRYDVSQDNEVVKNIRKKLGISGIYVADGSSKDLHKKVLLVKPAGQEYIERGFNVENDNSLSGCLSKLLVMMQKNGIIFYGQSADQDACIQLLWEVEDSLPANLKIDTGKQFLELAHTMYPDANNSTIAQYLTVWYYYSQDQRFLKNKGLLNAIKQLDKSL